MEDQQPSMSYDDDSDEQYEEDDSEEEMDTSDINFDDIPAFQDLPPLDPWRKVRRELIATLNVTREEEHGGLPDVYPDILSTQAAHEYAKQILDDDEDDDSLRDLVTASKTVGETLNCAAITMLEEDVSDPKMLVEPFQDASGLLLELYRDILLNPNVNHVGVGLNVSEMRIALAYVFSYKPLRVAEIGEAEDGSILIRGNMLKREVGVYIITIVDIKTMAQEILVGPPNIECDLESGEFMASVPYPDGFPADAEGRARKLIEFYPRNKPESIQYGQPSDEKFSTKHLEICHRVPLERFPDPRHMLEEAKDEEKKKILEEQEAHYREEQLRKKEAELQQKDALREEQRRILQEMERQRKQAEAQDDQPQSATSSAQRSAFRSAVSSSSNLTPEVGRRVSAGVDSSKEEISKQSSHESGEDLLTDEEDEQDYAEDEAQQQQVKEELLLAIQDALEQANELKTENNDLERKVVILRQKTEGLGDRTAEGSTNWHKYINTLTNVSQVQFKMQDVQEQYNSWAQVYEENIFEKQERCKEIMEYFREFKREVAKGAEFARTGKPIPPRRIDKWEYDETKIDKDLQEVRIQNITLKSRLAKLEQQSKEKEKLAEGLHVIDYEQLKIENQTLNEKIEDRNEEIHKLRKKIEKDVQILTHTKEKLQFVRAQRNELLAINDEKSKVLDKQRKTLNKLKKKRENYRTEFKKSQQETEIVNSDALNNDLQQRKVTKKDLQTLLKEKEDLFFLMQNTISRAKGLV